MLSVALNAISQEIPNAMVQQLSIVFRIRWNNPDGKGLPEETMSIDQIRYMDFAKTDKCPDLFFRFIVGKQHDGKKNEMLADFKLLMP